MSLEQEAQLKVVEPEIDQTQVTTDAKTIEQGLETQELPKKPTSPDERLAGLSAWGARALLKSVKPVAKEARRKVTLREVPVADVAQATEGKAVNIITPADELMKIQDQVNDITNAELKTFKTTDSHQVNFDTIESGDDVTATIAQMAENNKVEIDESRRGVITDELLTGLANDLGQDPNFIKNFLARQEGQALNAETVLASRQMLEQSAIKLKD